MGKLGHRLSPACVHHYMAVPPADGFTNVASLRPWIDKNVAQLLAGKWTGRGEARAAAPDAAVTLPVVVHHAGHAVAAAVAAVLWLLSASSLRLA